jgi:hypothetical protein
MRTLEQRREYMRAYKKRNNQCHKHKRTCADYDFFRPIREAKIPILTERASLGLELFPQELK